MVRVFSYLPALALGLLAPLTVRAQSPTPSAPPAPPAASPPARATGVAAVVNGQPVPESAVQRGLNLRPPEERASARSEIIAHLIDNLLLDQYLREQKVAIEAKEIEARIAEIRAELKKSGQELTKWLAGLMLGEEEFRTELTAELRWEKYAAGQTSEKALHDLFEKEPAIFDSSEMHVRHILIHPAGKDEAARAAARSKLLQIKKQIEEAVAQQMAKLPATADPSAREQLRTQCLESAFAAAARAYSDCPSKADGGELPWFPRVGSMVEPFAKAAFAMKVYDLSDVVETAFGAHLVLPTARRKGQAVKFEEVREDVRAVHHERLREALLAQLRKTAKVSITPTKRD